MTAPYRASRGKKVEHVTDDVGVLTVDVSITAATCRMDAE